MDPERPPIRTYGRLRSRAIKPRQAALMTTLLPGIAMPEGDFDPRVLAPPAGEVWLEIGFGGGEHIVGQAERRPDALVLGAEPFLNGVASALRHIQERGLTNVRLYAGDAREVMARLPAESLDRIFVLFPDPWPKSRHNKRRLVQRPFIEEAARLLRLGATLRFATDWADYADRALEMFQASPHFSWLAQSVNDWREPPADHITTRYEEKQLGDCRPIWLDFRRT